MKATVGGNEVNRIGTMEQITLNGTVRASLMRRRRRRGRAIKAVYYLLLTAASLVMSLPFFWLLSTSLTARGMEFQIPPQWIPDPIVWHNYYEAMFESGLPFPTFFVNTVIITVLSLIGTLLSA